jgi:uncharacterized membrane protein affecting hemolysin expression
VSDPLPAITACPVWNKLKHLVNSLAFLGRAEFDSGDQQLVERRQPTGLVAGFITLSVDKLLHTTHSRRKEVIWFLHQGKLTE